MNIFNEINWKTRKHENFGESIDGYVNDKLAFQIVNFTATDNFFCAFFLPKNWKNFGMSVNHIWNNKSVEYKTLDEAKKDCYKHLEYFGVNPVETSTL